MPPVGFEPTIAADERPQTWGECTVLKNVETGVTIREVYSHRYYPAVVLSP